MSYALSWLRGPKCVASSSSLDRIRVSLECTDLIRFFEPRLFSASEVSNGKPAPDLFLHVSAKTRVPPGDWIKPGPTALIRIPAVAYSAAAA